MNRSLTLRQAVDHALDAYVMLNFTEGYESALNGLDELSNKMHNEGDTISAELLRWAAKELRGENA